MGEIKAKARISGRSGDVRGVTASFTVVVPVEADIFEDGSWRLRGVKERGETKPAIVEVDAEAVEAAIADTYSDEDIADAYEGALALCFDEDPESDPVDEDDFGDLQ